MSFLPKYSGRYGNHSLLLRKRQNPENIFKCYKRSYLLYKAWATIGFCRDKNSEQKYHGTKITDIWVNQSSIFFFSAFTFESNLSLNK